MNKVVCDICGTSYPENVVQCPICGFAHNADSSLNDNDASESSYTYVKGGRFSKANVKKRTKNSVYSETDDSSVAATDAPQRKNKRSSAGLVFLIVILTVAILAVGGYILLRFFIPNDYLYAGLDGFAVPTASTETQEENIQTTTEAAMTEPSAASCNTVTLSHTQITFETIGESISLSVTCDPSDTTEQVLFSSDDTSVAMVDPDGLVVAAGEGSTVIRVSCGTASAQCSVTCLPAETDPEPETTAQVLMLNRKEITFQAEGESWLLYDGQIPVTDIIWSSDDNAVATITNGKVVAVGNGDTTVYGSYEGESVSCLIHCSFSEQAGGNDSGISEAGGDSQRQYKLYNPYGNADDVTIKVDEEFTLKLVDESKNEVTDAQWSVDPADCCSYTNGVVKGLKAGTANVTANYEGVTYTCIVRVS